METKSHVLSMLCRTSHPITHAPDGFDVESLVSELFPNSPDVCIERSRCRLAMISPNLVHQHISRQYISTRSHQLVKEIELLCGKCHLLISNETLMPIRIKLNIADAQHVASFILDRKSTRLNSSHT